MWACRGIKLPCRTPLPQSVELDLPDAVRVSELDLPDAGVPELDVPDNGVPELDLPDTGVPGL